MRFAIYGRLLRAMAADHMSQLLRATLLRVADPRSGVAPGETTLNFERGGLDLYLAYGQR
jgi:hypothetical protein